MYKFHLLFSTVLGIGYFPKAPGTAGSLIALLIFWFFPIPLIYFIALLIVLSVIGIKSASIVEEKLGEDPSIVVIDEFVGQGLAVLLIPHTIAFFLIAFILFRVFDIWKPGPINKSQELHGGLGIMLDDVLAGVFSNIIIQIIIFSGILNAAI